MLRQVRSGNHIHLGNCYPVASLWHPVRKRKYTRVICRSLISFIEMLLAKWVIAIDVSVWRMHTRWWCCFVMTTCICMFLHILGDNFHMYAENADYAVVAKVTIYIMRQYFTTAQVVMQCIWHCILCIVMLNHPHWCHTMQPQNTDDTDNTDSIGSCCAYILPSHVIYSWI